MILVFFILKFVYIFFHFFRIGNSFNDSTSSCASDQVDTSLAALSILECIDWCHMKVEWNRKVAPFDFPNISFLNETGNISICFESFKINYEWHFKLSEAFANAFRCSKNHHLDFLKVRKNCYFFICFVLFS